MPNAVEFVSKRLLKLDQELDARDPAVFAELEVFLGEVGQVGTHHPRRSAAATTRSPATSTR